MMHKVKKICALIMVCAVLCGCVQISDEPVTTAAVEESETVENDAVTEAVTEDSEVIAESKSYLEAEDYKKLIKSVSELVYMSRAIDYEEDVQKQSPEAVMYLMDYAFSAYAWLPISEPAVISGDPNGKITAPDSGLTCYTLPEKEVFWVFQNVFGWENMTLSEFQSMEYLEAGLCSNYYVRDGLVYYYSEDESWVSWGEEFVAGAVLSNGDVYFKVKAYDIYQAEFGFYIVARLKETTNGDKFWQFMDTDFEPMSVGMEGTEIVYINQPFDDSFEDAYVTYLREIVSGEKNLDAVPDRYSLRFMPVYINDDEIPEILISSDASHVSQAGLLSYVDGKVNYYGTYGAFGGLEYHERKGKICSSYSGMGQQYYGFYEFDGRIVKEYAVVNQTLEEVEGTMDSRYYINGAESTKQQIEDFLNKEQYSEYIVTTYDDYYDSDLITIAAAIKKYDGVAADTKLEWIKSEEPVPVP